MAANRKNKTKKQSVPLKKDGTPDLRYKQPVPLKKDGTPDLRYAVNQQQQKKKKKPTLYHRLLKESTKLNDRLPEERKLSLSERRKLIKNVLLPKYKKIPKSKHRVKDFQKTLEREFDKFPIRESCDVLYLDDDSFAIIEYFHLDETIAELMPDCVYVKVSAGSFGETKIFNTRDYEYNKNGVRDIVENIRAEAENSSGVYIFSGTKKLRPRRRNDGTPENYFMDFVLIVNDIPQADDTSVDYKLPKGVETKKKKRKIRQEIEQRVKKLKSKKDSRRRTKKIVEKKLKEVKASVKRAEKSPTEYNQSKSEIQILKLMGYVTKSYTEGRMTKKEYDKLIDSLIAERNKKKK